MQSLRAMSISCARIESGSLHRRTLMKRFHLVFGVSMFAVFLLTGQYMDKVHNHLEGVEDGVRLLYRTRHIFILMASLIHIGFGLYYETRIEQWRRRIQSAGSSLLTVGTLLLVIAFMNEPKNRNLETPYTHWGMYLILFGVTLHWLSGLKQRKNKSKAPDASAIPGA